MALDYMEVFVWLVKMAAPSVTKTGKRLGGNDMQRLRRRFDSEQGLLLVGLRGSDWAEMTCSDYGRGLIPSKSCFGWDYDVNAIA